MGHGWRMGYSVSHYQHQINNKTLRLLAGGPFQGLSLAWGGTYRCPGLGDLMLLVRKIPAREGSLGTSRRIRRDSSVGFSILCVPSSEDQGRENIGSKMSGGM